MGVSVVSPVFIGRQKGMTALASALQRVREGEPAVALVGGEGGVGKTRLVGELAGVASAAGFRVLAGQCIQLGGEGLPLAPRWTRCGHLPGSPPQHKELPRFEADSAVRFFARHLARSGASCA